MLEKDQIINVLKTYGYYSLNRAPFLYEENQKWGIYFVWPHKHFGNLERVIFFTTIEEVEEEVYKYWWFMNNKEKYSILIEFDNYETMTPKVNYIYKETPLTIDQMKNFKIENFVPFSQNTIKKRQLLRTATILILVLKEKIKFQNETYAKVTNLAETIKKLNIEYKNKLSLYKKGIKEEPETLELLKEEQDEGDQLLLKLHSELDKLETAEDIRKFIHTLFQYLVNIESNTSTIQNTYLLQRYSFEIEDLQKKIAILEEALQTKKKLFQSKQEPFELLLEVDSRSNCKKMMDIKTYMENEQKKVKEKYQKRESVDENVLGDYIVSFEKLNISLPPIIENNYYEEFDKEDLNESLQKMFDKLSENEKSACFVASSFLRECLIILMEKNIGTENIKEGISKLILEKKISIFNDAYMTLDHYVNAKIRVKYFSSINMKNFESFMFSLVEVIQVLKNMHQTLDKSFYAYYIEKKKEIVNLYLKNIVHLNKKTSYIARFMPNVPIYYSPVNITRQLDIVKNYELVERNTDIIFLLKDKVSMQTSEKKTIVVKYEKEKVSKEKITIVQSLKEKNKCTYYEDRIYSKEDEKLYE